MTRRITWRHLVLGAALCAPLTLYGGQDSGLVAVQLLAINDFHGHVEPPTGSNGQINGVPAGGAEYLATHVAYAVAENPNSLVVAAGDLIGASPLVSGLFHDEPAIEALNAMGLSVSSVGNHEFDEGARELLRMARGGCHPVDGCQDGDPFGGAAFQYLSANVVDSRTRVPLLPATVVRTVGGVKIGFIGETLQGTPTIVSPAGIRGWTFLDEAAAANAHAAALKRQGVHAMVLLIHEGGRQRSAWGAADPNGCADFSGPIAALAAKLTPDIGVIVSGHSHQYYNCWIAGRLVTSAASFGRMVTRITLDIDRSTGRIVSALARNQIVTRDVPRAPALTRVIGKYAALAEATAARPVGTLVGELTRESTRAGESALGEVIADAQLAAMSATSGAVVAFMNGGGLRADIVSTAVTYRDLFAVQPFGNTVMAVTMTGDMLKRLLEQQFDNPAPGASRILQVSNGFTYRYRASAPAGQHVETNSIAINGRPIAPADRVRVAVSNFLLEGGDGFTVFGEGTDRVTGVEDIDATLAYFKAQSPVAPGPRNRIVRID